MALAKPKAVWPNYNFLACKKKGGLGVISHIFKKVWLWLKDTEQAGYALVVT